MRLGQIGAALAFLSLSSTVVHANPAHVWSHRYATADDQWFEKVVVDASGNIVTCGNFYTSLALGQVYPSVGFEDAFVAKFDPAGNLLWVRQLGDVRPDRAFDVTVDLVGNVIVSGHMASAINDADAVVVKYAPDGTLRWLKRFGSGDLQFQTAMVVATNLSKEIIFAGEFDGAFSLGGSTLQPTGGLTFFMAKLDQNGNHIWSKRFITSTPYSYNLSGLEIRPDGQSILCGALLDSLDVGNGTLKTAGQQDIFLAQFDPNGNVVWAHRYGDTGFDAVKDIALSVAGRIAIVGYTNGSVDFGGGALTAGSDYDPFVAVLTASSGNHVWSKIFTGASNQYPSGLTWASNQDLLVEWRGSGTLDFGGGPLGIVGPEAGLWLTRFFGATGTYRWSTTLASTENMDGQIEEDNGRIIVTGGVDGDIDFGGGLTTGEADYFDLYVAKFDDMLTGVGTPLVQSRLGQNVPNPFNPRTTIPYTLAAPGRARVEIYNVSGAVVTVLDGGVQPVGAHSLSWNGRDQHGRAVASGVYFYRLQGVPGDARRMVLVK